MPPKKSQNSQNPQKSLYKQRNITELKKYFSIAYKEYDLYRKKVIYKQFSKKTPQKRKRKTNPKSKTEKTKKEVFQSKNDEVIENLL